MSCTVCYIAYRTLDLRYTLLYIQIHHPFFLHYKNIIRSADYQCRSRRQRHTAATMSVYVQTPHIDYQLDKQMSKLWVYQCHTLQLSERMCFLSRSVSCTSVESNTALYCMTITSRYCIEHRASSILIFQPVILLSFSYRVAANCNIKTNSYEKYSCTLYYH